MMYKIVFSILLCCIFILPNKVDADYAIGVVGFLNEDYPPGLYLRRSSDTFGVFFILGGDDEEDITMYTNYSILGFTYNIHRNGDFGLLGLFGVVHHYTNKMEDMEEIGNTYGLQHGIEFMFRYFSLNYNYSPIVDHSIGIFFNTHYLER